MGQYGNQPDFATRAKEITPLGNGNSAFVDTDPLNSAALYIGTGGTLVCNVVGGNGTSYGTANTTVFKNIPNGTFLPIIVNNVWVDDDDEEFTTCDNIVALY